MESCVTTFAIRLDVDQSPEDFERFMSAQVFASIDKGATRRGQVLGLHLLQGTTTDRTHHYLWIVSGAFGGGNAVDAIERIRNFGAQISQARDFRPVAEWESDRHP